MTIPASLHEALTTFVARERILIATDFDGVLAPLVLDPARSRPVDGAIAALHELADQPDTFTAIVSGRHLSELRQVSGVSASDAVALVGSHGAQPDRSLALDVVFDDAARDRLTRATEAVEAVAAAHPGTRIERKPAGVVLHTRGVPAGAADDATRAALAIAIPGVDVMNGKQMVELSVLSVTKGDALRALASEFGTGATLYLGDDVTDERAFDAIRDDDRNVTIKVGDGPTVADFRVQDPPDVGRLLQLLSLLRRA